jgi:stearoyl-CoA desaturase (delta-9 desaturase)
MGEKRKLCWSNILFLTGYHILLAVLLPLYLFYQKPAWSLLAITFILLYLTGLSITAGYHRLFSHTTYKTNRFIEFIYLFFGSMATQGSALRWSHDHRIHHAHIDEDKDPYTVKRGFWHAHFIWLFRAQEPIKEKVVSDLLRNPLIKFQHKYFEILMVVTNLIVTLIVGYLLNDYFGAFVFSWLLRLFFLHHFTWFINSLAHYWGHQNYSTEHSAVDNYIISLLTFGEGYHNYHHTFAHDYRNGIRWYHFDPTKWLIWTLSKFKLARDLKSVSSNRIAEAMIKEHKRALLEKLKETFAEKREDLESKVSAITDDLIAKVSKLNTLLQEYKKSKKLDTQKERLKELMGEISELKKSLKQEWREWKQFSKFIMKLDPDYLSA